MERFDGLSHGDVVTADQALGELLDGTIVWRPRQVGDSEYLIGGWKNNRGRFDAPTVT